MNSPDKFGIGKGPEAPAPPPVEGQPAPEVPTTEQPSPPSAEREKIKGKPGEELVIAEPPQVGEIAQEKPIETPAPARPINIGEHDLTGDIDIARADELQEEINT